jgi:hypothetical protein
MRANCCLLAFVGLAAASELQFTVVDGRETKISWDGDTLSVPQHCRSETCATLATQASLSATHARVEALETALASLANENTALRKLISELTIRVTASERAHNADVQDLLDAESAYKAADVTLQNDIDTVTKMAGPKGDKGDTGDTGATGADGARGPAGPKGDRGEKGEHAPQHGNWGSYGNWGSCSQTCGPGTQTRTRTCSNPAPMHGGNQCTGSGAESRSCTVKSCRYDQTFEKTWCVDHKVRVRYDNDGSVYVGGLEPSNNLHTGRGDCGGHPQGWWKATNFGNQFQNAKISINVIGGNHCGTHNGCGMTRQFTPSSGASWDMPCIFGCGGAQHPHLRIRVEAWY